MRFFFFAFAVFCQCLTAFISVHQGYALEGSSSIALPNLRVREPSSLESHVATDFDDDGEEFILRRHPQEASRVQMQEFLFRQGSNQVSVGSVLSKSSTILPLAVSSSDTRIKVLGVDLVDTMRGGSNLNWIPSSLVPHADSFSGQSIEFKESSSLLHREPHFSQGKAQYSLTEPGHQQNLFIYLKRHHFSLSSEVTRVRGSERAWDPLTQIPYERTSGQGYLTKHSLHYVDAHWKALALMSWGQYNVDIPPSQRWNQETSSRERDWWGLFSLARRWSFVELQARRQFSLVKYLSSGAKDSTRLIADGVSMNSDWKPWGHDAVIIRPQVGWLSEEALVSGLIRGRHTRRNRAQLGLETKISWNSTDQFSSQLSYDYTSQGGNAYGISFQETHLWWSPEEHRHFLTRTQVAQTSIYPSILATSGFENMWGVVLGAPRVLPEISQIASISSEFQPSEEFRLTSSVGINRVRRRTEFFMGTPSRYDFLPEIQVYEISSDVSFRPWRSLEILLGGLLLRSRLQDRILPYKPRRQAHAEIAFSPIQQLRFSFLTQLRSQISIASVTEAQTKASFPGYLQMNASAEYTLPSEQFKLKAEIENLGNRKIYWSSLGSARSRSLSVQVQASL